MNFPRLASSRFPWNARSSRPRPRKARDRRQRFVLLEALEERVVMSATAYYWTGAVDSNWSTPGNWDLSGEAPTNNVPGTADNVYFDGGVSNNSSTDDLSQVGSITIQNSYSGTVTLASSLTIPGGLSQSSGTVNAGASLTSGESFTVGGTGTFNANGGTVVFNAPMNYGPGTVDAPGVTFNNVTVDYGSNHFRVGTDGPLQVNGTLDLLGFNSLLGNDIDASGAVNTSVSIPLSLNTSTGSIVFDGAGPQTLTGTGDGRLPNVVINKPNTSSANKLTITGSIATTNWTDTKGAVDASASTVTFIGPVHIDSGAGASHITFGNVNINAGSNHVYVSANPFVVGGDLTLNSAQDFIVTNYATNPIQVQGCLTSNVTAFGNTSDNLHSWIEMTGGGNVGIAGGAFPGGGITINKNWNSTVNANVETPLAGPLTLQKLSALNGIFEVAGNVTTSWAHVGGVGAVNFGGSTLGAVLVFEGGPSQHPQQMLSSTISGGEVPGIAIAQTANVKIDPTNPIAVTGDWLNGGTFDATGSTVIFQYGPQGGTNSIAISDGNNLLNGSFDPFNNVVINRDSNGTINAASLHVAGNLWIMRGQYLNGTIDAYGNVTTTDPSLGSGIDLTDSRDPDMGDLGTGTIALVGNTNQTITAGPGINAMGYTTAGLAPAQLPSIVINQGNGGSVTLASSGNVIGPDGQPITAIIPPATSAANVSAGPIAVTGNWTNQSKSAVTSTGSTVVFQYGPSGAKETATVDDGGKASTAFNNVTINRAYNDTLAVTNLNLNGNLLITKVGAITGTINVAGNVESDWNYAIGGGGSINMDTANDASITANPGQFPTGGITINKPYATVTAAVTTPLAGTLLLTRLSNLNGYFAVAGAVTTNDHVGGTNSNPTGPLNPLGYSNTVLAFMGNKPQTLSATASPAMVPGLQINKTGGSLTIGSAISVAGDWTNSSATAINQGGNTITFDQGASSTTVNVDDGGKAFGDVTIHKWSGDTLNAISMHVNGSLSITDLGSLARTITAMGDVSTGFTVNGSGTVLFAGTSPQTLTASSATGAVPNVEVANGATLNLASGNDIGVTGNWTNDSGSTVNAGTSTVSFFGGTSNSINDGGQANAFYNVKINKGSSPTMTITSLHAANDVTISGRIAFATTSATPPMVVGNNLTFSSGSSVTVVGTIPVGGYTLITYVGILTGFPTLSQPAGYTLQNVSGSPNSIEIVQSS